MLEIALGGVQKVACHTEVLGFLVLDWLDRIAIQTVEAGAWVAEDDRRMRRNQELSLGSNFSGSLTTPRRNGAPRGRADGLVFRRGAMLRLSTTAGQPAHFPADSIGALSSGDAARSLPLGDEAVPAQRAHTSARPRGPPLPSLTRIASLHANRRVARDDDVGFLSPVTDPGPWTDSR